MYEAKQCKNLISRTLNTPIHNQIKCNNLMQRKLIYNNIQVCNNTIQGVFILKNKNNEYFLMDGSVNNNLYIPTNETKQQNDSHVIDKTSELNLFDRELRYINNDKYYPVYKNRILDLSSMANSEHSNKVKKAKEEGLENIDDEYPSTNTIYELLSDSQKTLFDQCLNNVRAYCKDEYITNVIEGALKNAKIGSIVNYINDSKNSENKEANNRALEVFLNRLQLMCAYISSVGEKSISNGKKIKDLYWIKPTGSDPHADGQHALFLISKSNQFKDQVYKQHDLSFEDSFMGASDSFLGFINQFINEDDLKLNTMSIDVDNHIEERIKRNGSKKNPISIDEFNTYIKKLGMLEVLTSVYGIADLHYENVMFNSNGPIAVDAECGGIFGSRFNDVANMDDDIVLNVSSLYVDNKQHCLKQDRSSERHFNMGKSYMLSILKNNKAKIKEGYKKYVKKIESFRLVPINTSDLSMILSNYIKTGEVDADFHFNRIVKIFKSYDMFKDTDFKLQQDIFSERFVKSIKDGILPSFECNIKNGNILLDCKNIGSFNQEKMYSNLMELFKKTFLNLQEEGFSSS